MAGNFSVGGIVSGLDSSRLVDSIMGLERRPLDLLRLRQTSLERRKAALGEFGSKLTSLQDKLEKLLKPATYQARSASSGDPKIASATSGTNAAVQSFTLNVTQLASRTLLTGTSQLGASVTGATSLAAAGTFAVAPTAGTFTVSVGVTSKTFAVATSDTLDDVLQRLNATDVSGFGAGFAALSGNRITLAAGGAPIVLGSGADTSTFLAAVKLAAAPGGATGTVTSTGPVGVVSTGASLSSANLAVSPGPAGAFKINGVQIGWTDGESLNSVITKINNSTANVAASYDAATDKLTLQAKSTGASAIALEHVSGGDLLAALGVQGAPQTLGKNAQYDLGDGVQRYSTSNTIADAVAGVSVTLAGVGSTTVGVAQDTNATVAAVRELVDTYNSAADFISQQTAVNANAKTASRFTGSTLFRSVATSMRLVVTGLAGVATPYKSLPEIGISTGGFTTEVAATKKLVLDEGKLTAALQNNQQAVSDLLTASGGPVATLETYLANLTGESGLLGSGMNSASSVTGREIERLGDQIAGMETRLEQRQASLQKKFTGLEQTMARLQAQSAQLNAQLASLSSTFGSSGQGQ